MQEHALPANLSARTRQRDRCDLGPWHATLVGVFEADAAAAALLYEQRAHEALSRAAVASICRLIPSSTDRAVGDPAPVEEHSLQRRRSPSRRCGTYAVRNESSQHLTARMLQTVALAGEHIAQKLRVGCTDPAASNFDFEATIDSGTCATGRRMAQLQTNTARSRRRSSTLEVENAAMEHAVLAITEKACDAATARPHEALSLRLKAAQLWPFLTSKQEARSCTSCAERRPSSCKAWFEEPVGLHALKSQEANEERKRRLRAESFERELRAAVESHLDKVCCIRPEGSNKTTGPEVECSRHHCTLLVRKGAVQRQAHMMRRMHAKGHVGELPPELHVGMDFVSPHEHTIPECAHRRPGVPRDPMTSPSDAECAARSALHHVAKKHGVAPEQVEEAAKSLGIDLASAMHATNRMFGGMFESSDRPVRTVHSNRTKLDHYSTLVHPKALSPFRSRQSKSEIYASKSQPVSQSCSACRRLETRRRGLRLGVPILQAHTDLSTSRALPHSSLSVANALPVPAGVPSKEEPKRGPWSVRAAHPEGRTRGASS